MSADNQLVIYKKELVWKIKNINFSGGCYEIGDEYQSLEDAVKFANEYIEENEVEYGLKIIS